jgi:hypothetical protein
MLSGNIVEHVVRDYPFRISGSLRAQGAWPRIRPYVRFKPRGLKSIRVLHSEQSGLARVQFHVTL